MNLYFLNNIKNKFGIKGVLVTILCLLIFISIVIIFFKNKNKNRHTKKTNALVIMFDQQQSYHLLPDYILDKLPGYQLFKKRGINFTNCQTNRNDCSQARACAESAIMNHGIQDVTNCNLQYNSIKNLSDDIDTCGKVFKRNNYKTAFYGKCHFDGRLNSQAFNKPSFCTNTKGSMKTYGYDVFNTWGESDFYPNGMVMDAFYLENILPPNSENFDFQDMTSGYKTEGAIPYLKARADDKDYFLLQYHTINPHDIEECFMNIKTGLSDENDYAQNMTQFNFPFMEDQVKEFNVKNPYYYSDKFRDAFIKNKNLTINFFEETYESYKKNGKSIPNYDSLTNDHVISSKTNNITPLLAGFNQYWWYKYCTCSDEEDFTSWKNLVNTYFGLVIEADSYVLKLYEELDRLNLFDNTTIIITSDHGEMLGAHGLRSKGQPYKESNNIPFIVCSPNISKELWNTDSDYLCSQIDLNSTLVHLSNLEKPENQFVGKSVFDENYNPKKNYHGNSALYILNGNQFLPTYYSYYNWYNQLDNTQQSNVYRNPRNLFEYQFNLVMVTTIYNDQLYKFGRYYSLKDLQSYNWKTTIINKEVLLNEIKLFTTKEGDNDIYISISKVLENLLPDEFTFNDGIEIIQNKFKRDNPVIYAYHCLTMNLLNKKYKSQYKLTSKLEIPGATDSYQQIMDNNDLTFFCFNLSEDSKEIYNLHDPKNIKSEYTDLFNDLNKTLNQSIIDNKCDKFLTILPHVYIGNCLISLVESIFGSIENQMVQSEGESKNKILNKTELNKLTYMFLQDQNEAQHYTQPVLYSGRNAKDWFNQK